MNRGQGINHRDVKRDLVCSGNHLASARREHPAAGWIWFHMGTLQSLTSILHFSTQCGIKMTFTLFCFCFLSQ